MIIKKWLLINKILTKFIRKSKIVKLKCKVTIQIIMLVDWVKIKNSLYKIIAVVIKKTTLINKILYISNLIMNQHFQQLERIIIINKILQSVNNNNSIINHNKNNNKRNNNKNHNKNNNNSSINNKNNNNSSIKNNNNSINKNNKKKNNNIIMKMKIIRIQDMHKIIIRV